jgi:ribonuclease T1
VRVRRPLIALVALVAALAIGYGINAARSHHSPAPVASSISSTATRTPLSALPPQVAQTVALIERGGPFPYPRNDGVAFHNNEHLLPSEAADYYREYTVPTPGETDRGARRIITGKGGEFYYTPDHYESFVRLAVG